MNTLDHLIKDIQIVSKVEMDGPGIEEEYFDLNEIIGTSIGLTKILAKRRNNQIVLQIDDP